MKILITGGAGYIGTELVKELGQNPSITEIVVYDNLSTKNFNFFLSEKVPSGNIRFIKGDLLDTRKLATAIEGVDIVYHLAAKVTTPFANEDPHLFEQVNHWGTAELSYILEDSDVQTVVYTSSTSVYSADGTSVNEGTEPLPKTYYGSSKYNGEKMLQRLSNKMNTYVLRCGNVYGYSKSMRFDAVINKFMFEAHYLNRIGIQGSGKQHRAFIHIKNVVSALSQMFHARIPSGTYNLVDKNMAVLDVAMLVQDLYPGLEMTFIQQEIEMKSLKVEPSTQLSAFGLFEPAGITDELQEFKSHFAFQPLGR